jgi:hypothetical protein
LKPDSLRAESGLPVQGLSYARPGPLGFVLPGFEPGFVVPGFDGFVDPGFGFPGFAPGFVLPGFDPGVELPGLVESGLFDPGLAVPGAVGVVLGVVPGVVPFGAVVGGCVVLFGGLGFVGLDPGVLGDGVAPVGGAVVLPVGGCAVLPVGGWPAAPVGGSDGVA